jgi:hypothetical protein
LSSIFLSRIAKIACWSSRAQNLVRHRGTLRCDLRHRPSAQRARIGVVATQNRGIRATIKNKSLRMQSRAIEAFRRRVHLIKVYCLAKILVDIAWFARNGDTTSRNPSAPTICARYSPKRTPERFRDVCTNVFPD